MALYKIPVIDCSEVFGQPNPAYHKFAREFGEGIEKLGVVYLRNHCFSDKTIGEMCRLNKEFFDLPRSVKEKYTKGGSKDYDNGYTNFYALNQGNRNTTYGESSFTDLRESWDFLFPRTRCIYPEEVANWKTTIDDFNLQLSKIVEIFLRCLAIYLELEDEETFQKLHKGFQNASVPEEVRLCCNYYCPLDPKLEKENQMRLGAHYDFGTMTFLFQDSVAGLETKTPDGTWIDVPPMEGAIILNVGLMTELWSGGKIRAPEHRVRLMEGTAIQERRNMILLLFPDDTSPCKTFLPKTAGWTPGYSYVENEKFSEFLFRARKKLRG